MVVFGSSSRIYGQNSYSAFAADYRKRAVAVKLYARNDRPRAVVILLNDYRHFNIIRV